MYFEEFKLFSSNVLVRFSCWMLRTCGDKSWSDGEGGGAAKATVPSSREAVKPSTLKAFIALTVFQGLS